jgi:hypothetical protein
LNFSTKPDSEKRMKKRVSIVAAFLVLGVIFANAQNEPPAQESAPDVPDAIAVPTGLEPVLFVHARGSQIYTCQAGADGKFSWTLKGSASGP